MAKQEDKPLVLNLKESTLIAETPERCSRWLKTNLQLTKEVKFQFTPEDKRLALGAQRIGEICGSLSKSLEVSLDIELPNPIDSIIDYIHAFHQYFDLEEFLITAKELNEDFTLKSLRIAN